MERPRSTDVELSLAIRERAKAISFGRELLRRGIPAVALDENGVLTEFLPDGTSRVLDPAGEERPPHLDGSAGMELG